MIEQLDTEVDVYKRQLLFFTKELFNNTFDRHSSIRDFQFCLVFVYSLYNENICIVSPYIIKF